MKKIGCQWIGVIVALMVLYCIYPMLQTIIPANHFSLVIVLVAIALLAGMPLLTNRLILKLGFDAEITDDSASTTTSRVDGIDLVRMIACVMVIIQHKLISIGYYSTPIVFDLPTIGFTAIRWLCQCSCPLFMMLTGFCLAKRKPDTKHYSGLIQTLIIYAVIAGINIFYVHGGVISCDYLKTLVNLNAFWYIDMYFGLYLLAPYLNTMWSAQTQKGKSVLIMTLICISTLGTVAQGWITTYWYGLYPITFYFIGIWVKESKATIRKGLGLLVLLSTVLLQTLYTLFKNANQVFSWGENFGGYSNGNNALPTMLCSFLLLIILKDIRISCSPIKRIVRSISQTSLVVYLGTCMFLGAWINTEIMPRLALQNAWVYFAVELLLELILSVIMGMVLNKGVTSVVNWVSGSAMALTSRKENE